MEQQLTFNSEHRLRSENLSFDADVWYPLVSDFTAKSVFIPLHIKEARAIKAYHDVSWRNVRTHLFHDEVATLRSLETELDSIITEKFSPNGTFLRLCGRSPKDGDPLSKAKIWNSYMQHLSEINSSDPEQPGLFNKLRAIARTSWMHVESGAEAMALLLSSERVYSDMIDWIKYGEPEQICLRSWEDGMSMDFEFRVFVCQGRITAISQYDHYSYFPHLHNPQLKDHIQQGIVSLWQQVHSVIDLNSYVVDVAYIPTKAPTMPHADPAGKFVVVELSPFFPCTGAALFDWTKDKDILEGNFSTSMEKGNSEVSSAAVPTTCRHSMTDDIEFRLRTAEDLHPQIEELLELNWDCRWNTPPIDAMQPNYEQLYNQSQPRPSCELTTSASAGAAAVGAQPVSAWYILIKFCVELMMDILLLSLILGLAMMVLLATDQIAYPLNAGKLLAGSTGSAVFVTLILSYILTQPAARIFDTLWSTVVRDKHCSEGATQSHLMVDNSTEVVHLFVYGTLKRGFYWQSKYLASRVGAVRCLGVARTCTSAAEDTQDTRISSAANNRTAHNNSSNNNKYRYKMVIGDSGVPYLFDMLNSSVQLSIHENNSESEIAPVNEPTTQENESVQWPASEIIGELWEITRDCLKSLDDYEGVGKGYYSRRSIQVKLQPSNVENLHSVDNNHSYCSSIGTSSGSGSDSSKDSSSDSGGIISVEIGSTTFSAEVYMLQCVPKELLRLPSIHEYTLEQHRTHYHPIRHIQVKQLSYIKAPSGWGKVAVDTATAMQQQHIGMVNPNH